MGALGKMGRGWGIEDVASSLGTSVDPTAGDALRGWLDLLVEWNAKLDLTAARSTDELLDLMLADAFVMAGRIEKGASVVDVGTGAGAPGLALAIVRPDLKVTLAEPLVKRVSFLRTVLGAIRRPDVTVQRVKGEELAAKGDTFDVAVSRATLSPAEWLALGERLATKEVWVLLAREDAPAPTAGSRLTQGDLAAYTWPRTKASRKAFIARSGPI